MCGIVGYTGFRNAADVVLEGLTRVEYRGYDSAGLALGGEKIEVIKCSGRVNRLKSLTPPSPATVGIGHTRWATHGAPTSLNAHPHLSADGKTAIVHNGIIENHAELRQSLIEIGDAFISDTDSEIIAHMLEYSPFSDMIDKINDISSKIEGAATFLVLCENDKNLYCHRKGAALIVGHKDGECFVASDMLALAPYLKTVTVLADGDTACLSGDGIRIYANGLEISVDDRYSIELTAAPPRISDCYMRSEIEEIPAALLRTYMSFKKTFGPNSVTSSYSAIDNDSFVGVNSAVGQRSAADIITPAFIRDRIKNILLVGCGTAYHAGLYGKEVFENFAEIPCNVVVASEIDRARFINSNTLAIFISQSGETADTLIALEKCKKAGARTLAITNVAGSSITFQTEKTLLLDAGAEIAVAATKSYNCQLLALYLLAKTTGGEDIQPADIRQLSAAAESLIGRALFSDKIPSSNLFFVGKGMDEITAKEGALKFKEITYKMTDAYAAGELKHGTIALIDQTAAVVMVATCSQDAHRISASVAELKSRGATVLGISAVGDIGCDVTLNLPPLDESCLYPIIASIPLQVLALACSFHLGLDPDKPRNLAKSVTVV